MQDRPALTRRTALASLVAAAGGAVLAGCTSESTPGALPAPEGGQRLDPDVTVAALALVDERETLALLEAASERHRRLRGTLAPMIAAHRAHADLLAEAVPDDATPTSPSTALESPVGSPSVTGSPGPGPREVPSDQRQALVTLTAAEQQLSTTIRRHAFVAESGQFARLLASISAACSQHAAVLSTTTVPPRRGGGRG